MKNYKTYTGSLKNLRRFLKFQDEMKFSYFNWSRVVIRYVVEKTICRSFFKVWLMEVLGSFLLMKKNGPSTFLRLTTILF